MKFTIVLLLLLSCCVARGQHNQSSPLVKGKSTPVYFDSSISILIKNRLDTLGISGFCWIKFKISPEGKIHQLEISPGTHPMLTGFLTETINKTSGDWSGIPAADWFILPVRYSLQKEGKSQASHVDPFQLDQFLLKNNNPGKPATFIFLPVVEYTSPFDGNYNFKKMKLQEGTGNE